MHRLNGRLRRLENAVDALPTPTVPDRWTVDMRVRAVRNIAGRVGQIMDHPCPGLDADGRFVGYDPFPELDAVEYLAACLPWFLERGVTWPEWARDAMARILLSPSVPGEKLPWVPEEFLRAVDERVIAMRRGDGPTAARTTERLQLSPVDGGEELDPTGVEPLTDASAPPADDGADGPEPLQWEGL